MNTSSGPNLHPWHHAPHRNPPAPPRRVMLRLALAVAWLGACSAGADGATHSPAFAALRSGTVHEALYSVALFKAMGVAVGSAGQVLESADAGRTWKEVRPTPTSLALFSVGVQHGHAVAVGQDGIVLLMDGSGKWRKVDAGSTNRLFAVSVTPGGIAVAAGAFGTVLKSLDGGEHWASIAPKWSEYFPDGEDPHLYAVVADDSGAVTLAGEFGLVLRSQDGGGSWRVVHRGDASLFALELRGDGGGYAVGQDGTVLRTDDHGASWRKLDVPTSAILLGVRSNAAGRVVISGMHELLCSRDGGGSWIRDAAELASSAWYEDVAADAGGNPSTVVGWSGRVARLAE